MLKWGASGLFCDRLPGGTRNSVVVFPTFFPLGYNGIGVAVQNKVVCI